ncbi:helix-turn-helix domain-containing protein [Halarcobacter mediterraneus]|nr:helix-turn-helix domain-containing protein [Halarcobacter mediterraneus]
MRKFDDILSRLYELLGVTKDTEFCNRYNVKANTLSTWKKRNTIPYELIVEISQNENFSLDYILKGQTQKNIVNYKEELLKTIDSLNNNEIKYLYYIAKSKELENGKDID